MNNPHHFIYTLKSKDVIITFSIILSAMFFRLLLINQSLWLDEAAQALESVRPLGQQLDIAKDFQPPLFHVWLHLFTYISTAQWWLRLASLIPGLITIWFSILIAKKIVNQTGAYLVGILMATSQYHLFYSQELRPYSLATMWGVVSTYALLKFIDSKSKKISWFYIFSTFLGLLSTYVYPFLIPAQLIILWMYQKSKLKNYLTQLGIVALLYVFWLPFASNQIQVGLDLKSSLSGWSSVVSLPFFKSIPLTYAKIILGRIQLGLDPQTFLLTALILIPSLYFIFKSFRHQYFRLCLVWLVVPVLLSWLVSFFIPVLEPKRVLFIQPAFYLLIAMGFQVVRKDILIFATLIVGNLLAIGLYLAQPINQREPWRQAISQIEQTATDNSGVIFAFNAPFAPWQWYQQRGLPTYSFNQIGNLDQNQLNTQLLPVVNHNQVYVFEYLMDLTDPNRSIIDWLEQNGFQESGFEQYPNMGKVWIFTKSEIFAQANPFKLN